MHSAPFDAHPPPLSSCFKRHGIIRPILQIIVLFSKTSNYFWRHCHHEVATLVDLQFFVSLVCHARAIYLMGKGARAHGGGFRDGGALMSLVLQQSSDSSVAGPKLFVFRWQPRRRGRDRPQGCQLGPRQLRRHQYLATICCLGGGSGFCRSECSGTRQDSRSAGVGNSTYTIWPISS